jgi:hypothetical protein
LKFLVEMAPGAAYFFGELLVALVGRAAKVARAFSQWRAAIMQSRFEQATPLRKVGKRVWPLWICPFLIAASLYRRVFWLDADWGVLRDLGRLFDFLASGPVFTLENLAPELTANKPALCALLPTVNGGVSGWDLVRDAAALAAYQLPILRACARVRRR